MPQSTTLQLLPETVYINPGNGAPYTVTGNSQPAAAYYLGNRDLQTVNTKLTNCTGNIVIDLRAINRRALDNTNSENVRYQLIARIAQRIVRSRQDWNGEVLSIRNQDLETIAIFFDKEPSDVLNWMESEKVLLKKREN